MIKTGIIIQARLGSKRFPKKIFQIIDKKNILEHVITRVKKVKFKKKIIIATTTNKLDSVLKKIAKRYACFFFKGKNNDVLNRFFSAASKYKINNIIRISADSPFIDPDIIEKAYKIFKKNKFDIVTNIQSPSYPKGMSVEMFSFSVLMRANKLAKSKFDKEHVTKVIYKNPKLFKIKNFFTKQKIRNFNFALDYKEEIAGFRKLYSILKKRKINNNFKLKDLITIMKKKSNI